ncbi:MAG: TetR family transcriptional regulator [Rhodococcus sp.]|nr:TetR family transcriptional regulator [Rhodococcus sp. (in: high G+C Gram-positive bacteria)]
MQLRRADVLDGAMSILNEYGLADLTMRRLATSLGVQPGALYWHFPNKQTLLAAMADTILANVAAQTPDAAHGDSVVGDAAADDPGARGSGCGDWSQDFFGLAHRMRSALLAHRDGAELVSATYASRLADSGPRDAFADIARAAGLSTEHAELASYTLLYYVLGHTVDEQSRAQMESIGALTRGPVAGATDQVIDEDLLDGDPAVRFDFGLSLFVDGIRARVDPVDELARQRSHGQDSQGQHSHGQTSHR